jgi:hypothetical protein
LKSYHNSDFQDGNQGKPRRNKLLLANNSSSNKSSVRELIWDDEEDDKPKQPSPETVKKIEDSKAIFELGNLSFQDMSYSDAMKQYQTAHNLLNGIAQYERGKNNNFA